MYEVVEKELSDLADVAAAAWFLLSRFLFHPFTYRSMHRFRVNGAIDRTDE